MSYWLWVYVRCFNGLTNKFSYHRAPSSIRKRKVASVYLFDTWKYPIGWKFSPPDKCGIVCTYPCPDMDKCGDQCSCSPNQSKWSLHIAVSRHGWMWIMPHFSGGSTVHPLHWGISNDKKGPIMQHFFPYCSWEPYEPNKKLLKTH